ncbi:MAG: hypothetical protein LBP78_03455 [Acidaminococcales bacterium]|jgi:hypothetical protein|nr:hypothetical protein [Acidaminococcales bacterium]
MNKLCKILTASFLSFLLLGPPLWGECYASGGYRQVPAAGGALNLPADAYVVEIDISDSLKTFLAPAEEAQAREFFRRFNMYQVVLNDGESYRSAAIMAFFLDDAILEGDGGGRPREEKDKFRLEYGQLEKILAAQKRIRAEFMYMHKMSESGGSLYAPPDKSGKRKVFKIYSRDSIYSLYTNQTLVFGFEWPDIEAAMINGEFGFKSDLRLSGSLFGFMANIYAAGFAFNHEGKGVNFLFFVAPGSEREFWAPIFEKTVVVQ